MGMRVVIISRHVITLAYLTLYTFIRQLLEKHSVKIRVLGRLDLLPEDVRAACRKAEDMTKTHTK